MQVPLNYQSPLNSPPTPLHLEQITAAKIRGRKIRRAIATAHFSGWTTGVFAILTLLGSLISFSLPGVLLGAGMVLVSVFEFRGAGEIKRLDPTAPKRLALNQLALGGLLFLYSAWSLWSNMHQPIDSDPEVAKMLESYQNLEHLLIVAIYGSLMAVSVIGPGLTALYYNSRKTHIEKYVTETPAWILELQRAGMSL